MSERPHIDIDPAIQDGEPCIGGTRLPALQMAREWWQGGWSLSASGGNWTWEQMQREYPTLTREGLIVACWWSLPRVSLRMGLDYRRWLDLHQETITAGRLGEVPLPPQWSKGKRRVHREAEHE